MMPGDEIRDGCEVCDGRWHYCPECARVAALLDKAVAEERERKITVTVDALVHAVLDAPGVLWDSERGFWFGIFEEDLRFYFAAAIREQQP